MSPSVRRRLAAWAGSGVLLVGSATALTRWRARAQRRATLDREYAQLTAQLCALDEDRLRRAHELRARHDAAARLRETVDVLWRDRLQRYTRVTDDLHAYVHALPEALGVLHGVTQHYAYMAREARRYVGFDVACAKLHSLALLLHAARRTDSRAVAATVDTAATRTHNSDGINNDGDSSTSGDGVAASAVTTTTTTTATRTHVSDLPHVLATLQSFFATEALVRAVCACLQPTAAMSCPASVADCSATFAHCMTQLNRSVDAAVARHGGSHDGGVSAAAQHDNNSSTTATTPHGGSDGSSSSGSRRRYGLLYEAVGWLVAALSFDTRTREERRVQTRQADLQRQLLRERYALHTDADVHTAVEYAQTLLRQLYAATTTAAAVDSSRQRDDSSDDAAGVRADDARATVVDDNAAAATTTRVTRLPLVSAADALLTRRQPQQQHSAHADDEAAAVAMRRAVRDDVAVQAALRDLSVWTCAAAVMLARAQALDALDCYHALLSTAVTHT